MNKKITLYELLGLVKDGQAPKKIKFKDNIYDYKEIENGTGYVRPLNLNGLEWLANRVDIDDSEALNSEVEILDNEDKEENKIPTEEEMETFGYNVAKIFKAYEKGVRMALEENNDIEELTYESTFEDNSDMEVQEVLVSKINELVREVNKLKKERK